MISLRGFELVRARGGGLWLLAVVMFGQIHEESGRVVDLQTVQKGSFVCREVAEAGVGGSSDPKKETLFLSRDSEWKQGTDQQWLRDSTDLFS